MADTDRWRLAEFRGSEMRMTQYLVIYRTATHVGYDLYDAESDAREDEHLSRRWNGSLYAIEDAAGFTGAEAKDLYRHGVEAMAPAWGIAELDVELT